MSHRILVLAGYFLRRLVFSLSGAVYIILALIYWAVLFPPGQGTPDTEYYILVIGAFGAVLTFLSALTIAARANRAANYPLVVRLPSRVEYLASVFISSLVFATLLQVLMAVFALVRGPELSLLRLLEIPPIWLATNVLAAVLALHASDLVTANWSRVTIYGLLAILLVGQNMNEFLGRWLSARIGALGRSLMNGGLAGVGRALLDLAQWIVGRGAETIDRLFGLVFWPFKAMAEATIAGYFNPIQALAPAVILLYATILFMFAADFFGTKDLEFTE